MKTILALLATWAIEKYKFMLARIFGKKIVTQDKENGKICEMTAYRYNGKMYVTDYSLYDADENE